jgi:hypothetical protein
MESVAIKLFYTLKWVLRIAIHNNQLYFVNHLNKLRFSHSNTLLKILGNGKSLNDVINSFENDSCDFMVVNMQVLSDSYQKIKPKYYVLADPYFFSRKEGDEILEKIKKETSWKMILFVPSWRKVLKKVKLKFADSSNVEVIPYNAMPFHGFESIKRTLYKYNLSCPTVTNVLVGAIYISICMKYDVIQLYGVEHNWTKYLSVNEANEVCIEDPHFYDKTESKLRVWNEGTGRNEKFCDVLKMYAGMFESYWELEHMAKREKVQIVNCTKGSFIDAFKKESL